MVTRWATLDVSSPRQLAQRRLGWPRPRRAAWLIGPIRRCLRGTNGPCSFKSRCSFKSPPAPQRFSDRLGAGWRLLSGCNPANSPPLDSNLGALHRTPSSTPFSTGLQAPLHSTPNPDRLTPGLQQTARLAFQRAFLWGPGVSLIFQLRPLTPRWLRPFCHSDPIASHARTW